MSEQGESRPDLDYRGLFDASPNAYLVLDRRLTIVGANRAYLRATRRTLDDIVGRWAWDAFPTDPDTLRLSIASFRTVLETRAPDTLPLLRFDIPRPDADGGGFEERYWSIVATPVPDASGEVSVMLQHPIDVTELQRLRDTVRDFEAERPLAHAQSGILRRAQTVQDANLSLRAEGARLRQLFEQAPGFMAMLREPTHIFEFVNPAFMRLIGHRDVIGKPVREALPELEGQGFFELLDQVRASGEAYRGSALRIGLQRVSGAPVEERFVDFVHQPVTDAEGRTAGIFIEGSDVTERVLADAALREGERRLRELNETLEQRVQERTQALQASEEQLRQSQKMEAVGQLTGGIAHDFNNLLAGIVGSLDLMLSRFRQGRMETIERYAKAAMSSAQRAAALTHRLLAFSRRQPLDPKPVDVNALLGGMEDLIRRTIGPLHALELVAAGGLWTTRCDPNQLESAILNLAINARDAMPEGGKLTVETRNVHGERGHGPNGDIASKDRAPGDVTPGDYVSIRVGDTGTGMAPEVIAKAFEPFFTTKPVGQGTGLGLSMVYGFVKQSEGHLSIDSEVGRGTIVSIALPRHVGGAAAAVAEPAGAVPGVQPVDSGEIVLVVEDETVVRDLVVDVLGDLGYRALEAADGLAGLKIVQSRQPIDLLVTDVGLPGLNGRQLAEQARSERPGLKVLFITGFAEDDALAGARLDPGMEMIAKPFAVDALASKIRAMIRNR